MKKCANGSKLTTSNSDVTVNGKMLMKACGGKMKACGGKMKKAACGTKLKACGGKVKSKY